MTQTMHHPTPRRIQVLLLAILLAGTSALQAQTDHAAIQQQPFPRRAGDPPAEVLYDFQAGFLGVHHQTDRFLFWDTGKGVRVLNVARGTAAQRGGLNRDDIITHFHGHRVAKSEELDRFVRETPAGSVVVIDLIRGAKRYQTVVELDPRPEFDELYHRTALQFPHPVPFIFDYEEYEAFDYERLAFVWPVLTYEKTGRKRRVTVVTWPLSLEYEVPR
jgi:hypothetical protein